MPIRRRLLLGAALFMGACGGAAGTDLNDTSGPAPGVDGGGGGPETGVPPGTDGGGPGPGTDGGGPLTCKAGTANCDGRDQNGCEVNTNSDDANCGGCKSPCASGKSCQAGVCVAGPVTIIPAGTLSTGDATCIALDDDFIYVSAGKANGDVYRVAKTGGMPTSIATNQANPRGIAADGSNVFWGNFNTGIVDIAKPDGSNAKALNSATAVAGVGAVIVDGQGVYWGNNTVGTVTRADKNGSKGKQLVPALAGTTLGAGHVGSIAVSGNFVYYADPTDGEVLKVPSDGSAGPTTVATNVPGARSVTVAGNSVLFTSFANGGQVFSVASSGPPATPVVIASAQGAPVSITNDATAAYWANTGAAGTIMKRTAAAAAAPIASAQAFPACVAVDASSVYWVNEQGAAVMRVAK